MSPEEAIETIEYARAFNTQNTQLMQAWDVGVEALQKQIPKKPFVGTETKGVLRKTRLYVCPTCRNHLIEKFINERQNTNYCWNCGQAIDWTEE